MELILLERIPKLGQMGDVVSVKKGYARNYLIPQGKALRATDANIRRFEHERVRIEARSLEAGKEAKAVAEKLDGRQFVAIRAASESGSLYGSVSGRDVAQAASEAGFEIARNQCVLDRPIKELGIHAVTIVLHPEVRCSVLLNVARSEAEAELQAAGRDIQDEDQEADNESDISDEPEQPDLADFLDNPGAAETEITEQTVPSDLEGPDADRA